MLQESMLHRPHHSTVVGAAALQPEGHWFASRWICMFSFSVCGFSPGTQVSPESQITFKAIPEF